MRIFALVIAGFALQGATMAENPALKLRNSCEQLISKENPESAGIYCETYIQAYQDGVRAHHSLVLDMVKNQIKRVDESKQYELVVVKNNLRMKYSPDYGYCFGVKELFSTKDIAKVLVNHYDYLSAHTNFTSSRQLLTRVFHDGCRRINNGVSPLYPKR